MNKFFPFVFIYFFINSLGLDQGLLYTTILAPLFYFWLISKGERLVLFKFFIATIPFVIAHFAGGVDAYYYARSYILLMLVYITVYAASKMLRNLRMPARIFDQFIWINFLFSCFALFLLGTPYTEPIWTQDIITAGSEEISRLRLFTYEPSYYATLMVPLFVLSVSRLIRIRSGRNYLMLALSTLPMSLAFSFGVIASLSAAFCIVMVWKRKEIFGTSFPPLFLLLIMGGGLALFTSADNVLFLRVDNVLSGEDSSGSTRTLESNLLAYQIAQSKSLLWGVGFGQSKLLLPDITGLDWYRTANAVASTFETLGALGLVLRFGLELYLFVKTRVYFSHFRLVLFIFAFIYQFTGSFITNLAEYVIWMLAFTPIFMEFESKKARCQGSTNNNYGLFKASERHLDRESCTIRSNGH